MGESLFGSLTNKYGNRFTAKDANVMKVRTAPGVLAYQFRLLIRIFEAFVLNVRHAPNKFST